MHYLQLKIALIKCKLIVLVKFSVLAKWLARKTPLRKPNHGEGIVSTKPTPNGVLLFHCFNVCLSFVPPPLHNTFHTPVAGYSLFVLKAPLNTNHPTNQQSAYHWCCRIVTIKQAPGVTQILPCRIWQLTVTLCVRDLWGYRSLVRRVICPKWSCADSEIWR